MLFRGSRGAVATRDTTEPNSFHSDPASARTAGSELFWPSAGVGADLQLGAVDVAEEQAPLVAEHLDLADVGAHCLEPVLHPVEGGSVGDRDAEVVDGAPGA